MFKDCLAGRQTAFAVWFCAVKNSLLTLQKKLFILERCQQLVFQLLINIFDKVTNGDEVDFQFYHCLVVADQEAR